MKRELANVKSFEIGQESHGILTFMVQFDLESGGCQGMGNISLDRWSPADNRRVGTSAGMDLIIRMFDFFGISSTNDLKKVIGTTVYVLRASDRWNEPIIGMETTGFASGGKKFFVVDEWMARWKGEPLAPPPAAKGSAE